MWLLKSTMAQMVKNLPAKQETQIQSLEGLEIPWRRKWLPTPLFLPGKSYGQRSLVDYSSWGCKELDTTEATNMQDTHKGMNFWYSQKHAQISKTL